MRVWREIRRIVSMSLSMLAMEIAPKEDELTLLAFRLLLLEMQKDHKQDDEANRLIKGDGGTAG